MFRRNGTGLRPLNIPRKWLVMYCIAVAFLMALAFSLGRYELGILLLGGAFCVFAAADVLLDFMKRRHESRLRMIVAVLALLAAFGGLAVLFAAYVFLKL